jgi:hypothetical protein
MSSRERLETHGAELSESLGINAKVHEAGRRLYVLLEQVALPPGAFRAAQTDVLFMTDHQYPLSAMDMFWTEPGVLRPDGSIPRGAEWIETHLGRRWRRFSWHRQGSWRTTGNPLFAHFALMEARFAIEPLQEQVA